MDKGDVALPSPRGAVRTGLLKNSAFRADRKSSAVVTEDSKYNLSSVHSYHEEEKEGLVDYINGLLHNHYSDHEPITPKSNDIFDQIKGGILLCRIVNAIQPGVIDNGRINLKDKLSIFEKGENLMLALQTSQDAFGISFVNIGVEDLIEGRPVLVLSVLWQLVNIDLRTRVRFFSKEIDYLKQEEPDGAGAEEDLTLPTEYKLLLRWVNHHLAEAGSDRRVDNFASDIKDSVAYTVLLHQLAPQVCTLDALSQPDLQKRADLVLLSAEHVGCRKFVSADDILQGNQRLNFAFVAYIFTKFNLPPRLAESKAAEERIDEQAIVLADIHKERRDVQVSLNKTQDKIKEGWSKVAQAQEEVVREERERQDRINDLEITQQVQKEKYTAKVQVLKEQLAHVQASQLPSVPELKKAIEAERAEQEVLLQESEAAREEIKDLKVEVVTRTSARAREENLLARVNHELKTIEADHAVKAKSLNDRIAAIGITALQQKLDEAVAQTEAITATHEVLIEQRDTLMQQVNTESTARTKASAARKRVEMELEKAKKNLEEKRSAKVATAAATTKLEKKLVDIKKEITTVKKDVIFVEYQISNSTEELEGIKEDTKKIISEKKSLNVSKSLLRVESEEIQEQITEVKIQTEVEVKQIKEKNEEVLEVNRKKNSEEIRQHKDVGEVLTDNLVTAATHLQRVQMEIAAQAVTNEIKNEEIRGLQREVIDAKKTSQELIRETKNLHKKAEFVNTILKEELETAAREEQELQELKKEQEKQKKIRDAKLTKREELEKEMFVKELEAKYAAEFSDELDQRLRINKPRFTAEDITKKGEILLTDEENRRNRLVAEKEYINSRMIGREKESHEKKISK